MGLLAPQSSAVAGDPPARGGEPLPSVIQCAALRSATTKADDSYRRYSARSSAHRSAVAPA